MILLSLAIPLGATATATSKYASVPSYPIDKTFLLSSDPIEIDTFADVPFSIAGATSFSYAFTNTIAFSCVILVLIICSLF